MCNCQTHWDENICDCATAATSPLAEFYFERQEASLKAERKAAFDKEMEYRAKMHVFPSLHMVGAPLHDPDLPF